MNYNTFKLEEYLGKYEFSAKYLLCCSDVEAYSMSEILNLASNEEKKLWDNLKLGYTEVCGAPQLRETVARKLYSNMSSENILMFAGAEEGIFCTLHALISSEDHVIVITPCYQSLTEIPKAKGAKLTEIELKEENEWKIDLNHIENSIRPDTKFIIINFPHNPTGQIIEQSELRALVNLCQKHDIWLFSDEVYRLLGQPSNPWSKPAANLYDKAISLSVMSKAFGMPGLRVGWIACQDQKILKKIEQMKHYASICNSAPSEILSMISLNNIDTILERNNQIVEENLKLLNIFLNKYNHLFEWIQPQGGCIGFIKYKSDESVSTFCDKLLQSKSTLLLPACIYDYTGNHFRVGFGRKNMPGALSQIEEFINERNN